MTATATPKTAKQPSPHEGPGGEWAIEQAVRIVASAESPDQSFDPGDLVALQLGGISPDDLPMEISRSLRARKWLPLAGTRAEYASAAAALAAADKTAAERRPELEAAKREAQDKLAELDREVEAARKKVENMDIARSHLADEDILPKHIRARLVRARHLAATSMGELGDELRGAPTRIEAIKAITSWGHDSPEARQHAEVHPELYARDEHGNVLARVDREQWQQHRQQLNAERAELEAKLAKHGPTLAARKAEAESLRNYYLNTLG